MRVIVSLTELWFLFAVKYVANEHLQYDVDAMSRVGEHENLVKLLAYKQTPGSWGFPCSVSSVKC